MIQRAPYKSKGIRIGKYIKVKMGRPKHRHKFFLNGVGITEVSDFLLDFGLSGNFIYFE